MKIRDYFSDAPWHPARTAAGRVGNWRRRRFAETGKGYRLERATRGVRSTLPVYRDRINPATGRPRRDDAEIYRRRDAALAARRADRAVVRDVLARSQEAGNRRVREHADKVLGPGTADRAAQAHRQANANPWEQAPPVSREYPSYLEPGAFQRTLERYPDWNPSIPRRSR